MIVPENEKTRGREEGTRRRKKWEGMKPDPDIKDTSERERKVERKLLRIRFFFQLFFLVMLGIQLFPQKNTTQSTESASVSEATNKNRNQKTLRQRSLISKNERKISWRNQKEFVLFKLRVLQSLTSSLDSSPGIL